MIGYIATIRMLLVNISFDSVCEAICNLRDIIRPYRLNNRRTQVDDGSAN